MFLQYLKESGTQNTFPFQDGDLVGYQYFYTGNVSVRKSAFDKIGGFDEDFKVYGVEDIDLGYRLSFVGEKVKFCKKALSFHDYHPDHRTFMRKKKEAGYSLGYFLNKYPHLQNEFHFGNYPFLNLGRRNLIYKILAPGLFLWKPTILTPLKYNYFHWTTRWEMYKGLLKYQMDKRPMTLGSLLK